MTQRISTFMFMARLISGFTLLSRLIFGLAFFAIASNQALADPANTSAPAKSPVKKSPDVYFAEGIQCLKQQDFTCAQLALNSIPSQSNYAKLLAGSIAANSDDTDRSFLLLLPLQADTTLSPLAVVSLHASLALAYEKQADASRALEQLNLLDKLITDPNEKLENQTHILKLLSNASKDELIAMRGESPDTIIQGWIDLALAIEDNIDTNQSLLGWKYAYPEHPGLGLISQHLITDPTADKKPITDKKVEGASKTALSGLHGKIGLILPFGVDAFYAVADAIQQGVLSAQTALNGDAEVKIYVTNGAKDQITSTYQQALADGVNYVIGPLTRDEVTELSAQSFAVPTVVLNQSEIVSNKPNLYFYGLNLEAQTNTITQLGVKSGMQTATIVLTQTSTATRLAKAFGEAWLANGGQIKMVITVPNSGTLDDIKSKISANPSDMIFLATTAEEARNIRPYLDVATPTFASSNIYAGLPRDQADAPLKAIQFVDMPLLLNPDNPEFKAYKADAASLPRGEMQRWFAIGVDAYQLLAAITQQQNTLNGLSGKLQINANGNITRELALGHFSLQGIVLDSQP